MPHLFCRFRTLPLFAAILFLSASEVSAQEITPVGVEGQLTVATWNIEWFGRTDRGPFDTERQFTNVLEVIRQSGIHIWAVQEIASRASFNRLLDSLGSGFQGLLSPNCDGRDRDPFDQRIGYIFSRDLVSVRGAPQQILTDRCDDFATRAPYRLDVSFTFPDTTVHAVLINLHMKAFADEESYQQRVRASSALKTYIDNQRMAGLLRNPVVIFGDYNDLLLSSTRSGAPSPYANFVNDSQNYYPVTRIFESPPVRNTYCSNSSCTSGSPIDHIVITRDLLPHYELDSSDPYRELLADLPGYRSTTSDHLPVYARFEFRTSTASEEMPELPAAAALTGTFPNPFDESLTVRFELSRVSAVDIQVFDALGRRVHVVYSGWQAPGSYEKNIDASSLPAGMYLIRLRTEGAVETMRVVKAH